MRKVESCFQRLEQRYASFTPGPARADRFLETVSPAPAAVVRTSLLSVRQQSQKSTRTQKSGHYPAHYNAAMAQPFPGGRGDHQGSKETCLVNRYSELVDLHVN
jgi:hypothetical protein